MADGITGESGDLARLETVVEWHGPQVAASARGTVVKQSLAIAAQENPKRVLTAVHQPNGRFPVDVRIGALQRHLPHFAQVSARGGEQTRTIIRKAWSQKVVSDRRCKARDRTVVCIEN